MTTPLPFIPFAECCEVAFIGTMGSQLIIFSMGVQKIGGFLGTDQTDLANGALDWYGANLRGSLADDYTLQEVKVTDLATVDGAVVEVSCTTSCAGAASGAAAPNNCAQVVSLKTAKRGRSFRGRVYLPAIPSSALYDASHITSAQVTLNASAMGAWKDMLDVLGMETVVLSRFNAGARRTTGVATPVTQFLIRDLIGTQRRRIAGRGA